MLQHYPDLAGTVLGGRYLLTESVGQGGYAHVYRAWQAALSRQVAVKVLQPQADVNNPEHNDFLARFQREASIAATLQHHRIIAIYDYGEENGLAYLVMPYLAHGTLHDVLRRHGRLSLPQAIAYIEQAAEALDYAHSRGIVHRDLKPSNFLLNEHGDLVLADFGIARLMQHHYMHQVSLKTRTDTFIGTPLYAAPEMIQPGEEIDHRVDIYELGIVFFQMLYGEVPFKGQNNYAILHQHVSSPLPQLSQLVPTIPQQVDIVLQKATAKRREGRYNSAGEFARALRRIIHHPPQSIPSQQHRGGPTPVLPPTVLPTPHQGGPLHLQKDHLQPADIIGPTTPALPISPRKKSKRGLLAVMLPIVFFLLIAVVIVNTAFSHKPISGNGGNTPTVVPRATPTLTPDQLGAKAAIQRFYADLNNRDYQHAYMLLYPTSAPTDLVSQAGSCSPSYRGFLDGYKQTEQTIITFVSVSSPNNQQQYTVKFTVQATEYLPTGIRKSTYHVYDTVKRAGSGWQIIPGKDYAPYVLGTVTPSTTTGTAPSDQPQTIVQKYFDALKVGDYPLAYSFLSQSYSASYPYCDFVLAHTDRLYNSPNIAPPTSQADGTAVVAVNVFVTEPANTSQATNIQQENFTLAQEQGVWKIVTIASPAKNAT